MPEIGSTLPAPLTPADCNLQDFAFMPLDVARLRDSDLSANETPEACWAALLLWSASWHQVPAASIPNDDNWLAKTAGYMMRGKIDKAWKTVRAGALRGFIECVDGRLYHPVVAEKARDAWQAKLEQRWRTECARIKKHNDRHEGANVQKPTYEQWLSLGCPQGHPLPVPGDTGPRPPGVPGEEDSKRQGEGQGQGQGDSGSVPYGTGGDAAVVGSKAPAANDPIDDTPMQKLQRRVDAAATLPVNSEGTRDRTAETIVWNGALAWLLINGISDAKARTLLGKFLSDNTDDRPMVIDAFQALCIERPIGAAAWLTATIQVRKGERTLKPKFPSAAERRAEDMSDLVGEKKAPNANQPSTRKNDDAIDVQSRVVADPLVAGAGG